MKRFFLILIFFASSLGIGNAQIAHYNQYPTLYADDTYIDISTNCSFAYSMRKLTEDYIGPLIELRRASDNATMDFYPTDTELVDVTAIDAWANGSNMYVRTWYDQSTSGRNAVQTTNNRQPRFYTSTTIPYFAGDGSNDYLEVQNGNIQNVTNAGKEGTVLFVINSTKKAQTSFGVKQGNNRWSVHLNWSNNYLYFDPGLCCYSLRRINNTTGVGNWKQFTLQAGNSSTLFRRNTVTELSGAIGTQRCTLTSNFGISAALNTSNNPTSFATTKFNELILFNTDIASTVYEEIENNQITFWGIN